MSIESVASPGPEDGDKERPKSSVSVLLVEAREAAGLDQKQVAEQLYLSTTFIRYLDEGHFEKFPKKAFIRGYLRAYSRVVGIPEAKVISRYDEEHRDLEAEMRHSEVTGAGLVEQKSGSPLSATTLVISLIGLVALLVLWLFQGS